MNGLIYMTSGIENYIPQRPPFVFIDTVLTVDAEQAVTQFTIPADCPLVVDGVLPLSGLMENAAQTCAVRAGQSAGNKIGYIGAVKQLEGSPEDEGDAHGKKGLFSHRPVLCQKFLVLPDPPPQVKVREIVRGKL